MMLHHPFVRKLAGPLGAATVLSIACSSSDPTAMSDPGLDVAALVITPRSAVLEIHGSVQFSAHGLTAGGDSVSAAVDWSTTGGTVSDAGLYTAGGAGGSFLVIATATTGSGLADTADVTVDEPAPVLVSVAISPHSVTLDSGESAQFTLSGEYSDSHSGAIAASYAATGGDVSPSGLYTAGADGGEFMVVGSDPGTGLADTAHVTIVSAPVLVSVAISPHSVTLDSGESAQFTLSGEYSDSHSGAIAASYAATGGDVSPSGLYTAGADGGEFMVVGSDPGTGLADTAHVTIVSAPPPALERVTISPASVTVQSGQTQQFTLSGLYDDGSSGAVPALYASTGGSVTAAGLFTAGGSPGTYAVIGTEPASGLADTAVVSVTSPSTSGFTTVYSVSSFAGKNLDQIFSDRSGGDGTQSVEGDWFRETIPPGKKGGWADIFMDGKNGHPHEISSGTVRWTARVRLSANWAGKGRLLDLIGTPAGDYFAAAGAAGVCPAEGKSGDGSHQFFILRSSFAEFEPGYPLRYYDQFVSQTGTTLGNCYGVTGSGGGFGTATFYGGDFLPAGGADFVLTDELMLNTPGLEDGYHKIYIDGVLRAEFRNIQYRQAGSGVVLSTFGFKPFISSGGNPATSSVYVEYSEVSLEYDPSATPTASP